MILKTNNIANDSIVPIDDQMKANPTTLFEVFYFGERFSHYQLTTANPELVIDGHVVVYNGQEILIDDQPYEKTNANFIVMKPNEYQTIVTNKPKKDFTISSMSSSAISLETAAFVSVTVKNKMPQYNVAIYANKEKIYFNGKLVEKGSFDFVTGNQLVIDKLIIEVREKQLKLTTLGTEFTLNPFELIEQSYKPEYPSEFPLFRRSPRIHLKEPKWM